MPVTDPAILEWTFVSPNEVGNSHVAYRRTGTEGHGCPGHTEVAVEQGFSHHGDEAEEHAETYGGESDEPPGLERLPTEHERGFRWIYAFVLHRTKKAALKQAWGATLRLREDARDQISHRRKDDEHQRIGQLGIHMIDMIAGCRHGRYDRRVGKRRGVVAEDAAG